MANGWTEERRAKQAAAIKQWRPWEKSTGPRTVEGKATSSQNALVHFMRSQGAIEERKRFNEVMRRARGYIRDQKEQLKKDRSRGC